MSDIDFLETIFKYVDIDEEYKKFAIERLYKYAKDPVVNEICSTVELLRDSIQATITCINDNPSQKDLIFQKDRAIPLFILCPDKKDHFRVFPNIIVNNYSTDLLSLSSLFCNSALKAFLAEYETDLADPTRKLKWEEGSYKKRINQFIDMPTARALTRYIFEVNVLKDSDIRDYANSIDAYRKPFELSFADTPKDFYTMYTNGVSSCMSTDTADGREKWAFFGTEMAPTSFFSYVPHTRGVYIKRGEKVVGRTILYCKKPEDPKAEWKYGRIYCPEFNDKFVASLNEAGFKPLSNAFEVPKGESFTVPGFFIGTNKANTKDANAYACPYPYFDNLVDRFMVEFNSKTKEFTFTSHGTKGTRPNNRSGHLLAKDYISIECACCNASINLNQLKVATEDQSMTFCSDDCAMTSGFVCVLDGQGRMVYKRPDPNYVDVFGDDFLKLSTIRAAHDRGYSPLMTELGVTVEEGSQVLMYNQATYITADGSALTFMQDPDRQVPNINPIKIPIGSIKNQKTVTFDDSKELYVEAA